jgi:hypothetical protein
MAQTKIYVLLGNKRDLNGLFGPNKRTGHRDDEGSLTNRPQKRRGPLKNIKISALYRRSAVRRHPICRRERQPLPIEFLHRTSPFDLSADDGKTGQGPPSKCATAGPSRDRQGLRGRKKSTSENSDPHFPISESTPAGAARHRPGTTLAAALGSSGAGSKRHAAAAAHGGRGGGMDCSCRCRRRGLAWPRLWSRAVEQKRLWLWLRRELALGEGEPGPRPRTPLAARRSKKW